MPRQLKCECGECQICKQREYMRAWYSKNTDRVRGWSNRYRNSNLALVQKRDRERGHRVYNKDAEKARRKLNWAVQSGKMIREPCEVCGAKSEAHHPDYSKPYEVQWLCHKHHMILHRKVGI